MRTYSKRSSNPKDYTNILNEHDGYGSLSIDINPIPWNCQQIQYSVTQINFTANYYITTPEDYVTIEYLWDPIEIETYHFEYLTDFDINNLATYLEERVFNRELAVMTQTNGTLSL
jgi:hypothetical protein